MRGRSVAALIVLLAAAGAEAHTRSTSYSSWVLGESDARITLRITQLDLTRLPWGPVPDRQLDPDLAEYLTGRLRLVAGSEPCRAAGAPLALASPPDRARVEWRVECTAAGPLRIESDLLLEVAPSHVHFARVRVAGGPPRERVLGRGARAWPLEERDEPGNARKRAPPTGSSITAYVGLGIEHIWTGYDHLAFVLALVLIAARLGEVATVVTGFTIAHSLTLAAAVLGWAEPQARAVEALIGLSIALVAAENGWLAAGRPRAVPIVLVAGIGATAALGAAGLGSIHPLALVGVAVFSLCYFALLERIDRPARLRVCVAFAFGLVHGFGFAGVLAEMELPTARLAPALFGFNAGVEIGQLAVVATLWPLLRWLARQRQGAPYRLLVEAGSAAVCGLGLFWFVTRTFG